jgi:hypothetical protein
MTSLFSPGFSTPEVEADFDEEAIKLWKQLQKELAPNYEVVYFSDILGKVVTHESELEALRTSEAESSGLTSQGIA